MVQNISAITDGYGNAIFQIRTLAFCRLFRIRISKKRSISMDEKLKKLIFLDAEKTAYVDLPILCTVTIVIFPNRRLHVLNAVQVPRPAKDVK